MKSTISITEGSIIKPLLLFFFPILFGTFFQQLYNTVDALVVGNFIGKEALAAVGGTTAVYINLFVGFFVGLSSGAAVLISQFYGSREYSNISKTVHTSIFLGVFMGIGVSIIAITTSRPILSFLNVPIEIIYMALDYIYIYFAGFPFMLIYNMGCSILRAIGDSKRPVYFLIVSCIVNIILDIVFVCIFNFGVKGAAFATIIAQFISMTLILYSLSTGLDVIRFDYRKIIFDSDIALKIIKIGLPAGIQSVLYTISNLIISSKINAFGVDAIAANTSFEKIDAIFWMINQALGISITTFVGQNFGANNHKRIKQGVNRWLVFGIVMALIISTGIYLAAPYLFAIFNQDINVINIGIEIVHIIAPFWFIYIPVEIIAGSLRGMGDTFYPTLFTALGIVAVRVAWFSLLDTNTLFLVFVIYPITWIITALTFSIYYYSGLYKHNIKLYTNK